MNNLTEAKQGLGPHRIAIRIYCYGFGILFHVTWSRALARLAEAVWSGRTRVFVRTDPL